MAPKPSVSAEIVVGTDTGSRPTLTRMYDPVRDGVGKSVQSVVYAEARPDDDTLADLVHCFWELRTETELDHDFTLHAMPDACVNVLLNQHDPDIAGITQLHTRYTTLDLGRSFHYAGIQFFPGVWRGDPEEIVDDYIGDRYEGDLPLIELSRRALDLDFEQKTGLFAEFVTTLRDDGVVAPNPVTAAILTNLDHINTVGDMATVAALSPRQLQRTLKATTGFAPHDLLKVLRLQHSFRRDYLWSFADQSHYTHSFRNMIGYTPNRFHATFDV